MGFINNDTTRIAIEGMAELCGSIVRLTPQLTPVFYVTNSGWNLYNLLCDFLELQGFPKGALLMQKIDMTKK